MQDIRQRARERLREWSARGAVEGFIDELRHLAESEEDRRAVDELDKAARRINRLPTRRGPQRARRESVILSNAVYDAAELEARLGRTLWRRIRKVVAPLVRGRYAGAAVQAALDAGGTSARVMDIHHKPERARREKNHAKSTGTMRVRITR